MKIKTIAIWVFLIVALVNIGIYVVYQYQHPQLTRTQCCFDCWINGLIALVAVIISKLLTRKIL